ncbi:MULTISPECIES: tetratricopeptide repeat protein [Flavobacterium]|uniref:tetratricopeptide repeat protein n=1 Tax=Flavobacterium TaxID=237 RepID=UPI001182B57C|nr:MULTISPECIES: tetratricopeptide repeat protein [Flavobacterium]MCR4033823.1 tetratricopeptide repeat protein [Flavobacterium panacis]
MTFCTKKIRFFFVLYAFVFCTKLQSQKLHSSSTESVSHIESIILKENNPKKDTVQLKKRLNFLKESSNKKYNILYDALLANGYSVFFDKTNPKSEYYYLKSIQEAEKSNDLSLVIWTQLNYSKYLYFYCQINELTPIVLKTMEESNQIDASELILPAETFKFFGWIMMTIGDDSAVDFLKKSMQYMKDTSSESADVLNAIGNFYFKKKDLLNAMHYFDRSEVVALKMDDSIRYAKILGDKALVYNQKGDVDRAVNLLKQDITYSQKFKIEKNEMYASIQLAKIFLKLNDKKQAEEILETAGKIAGTKAYYRSSLKEIIDLKLTLLNGEDFQKELTLRRQLKQVDEYLLHTNGNTVLRKSNWLIQKKKYENETKKILSELEKGERIKNISLLILISTILSSAIAYGFLSQRLENKKLAVEEYENDRLLFEEKLKDVSSDIDGYTENLQNKEKQISILEEELEEIKNFAKHSENEKNKLQQMLSSHIMTDENWSAFKKEFINQYSDFYHTIIENFPEVKESNLKIIMLEKLNLNYYEMSNLLGVTVDAVKKNKQRLKKKLGDKYDLLFEMVDYK